MSVNISIKEGDVSRIFSNISKLKVNKPGGGTVDFIPEGEADDYANTGEITITKNGTYEAVNSGHVGFSKVVVNVPTGAGNVDRATVIDSLLTNLTAIALRPNIRRSTTSWEWVRGRDPQTGEAIRTFSATAQNSFNEYISIDGRNIKYYFQQVATPSSYADIPETDVDLLTLNNKQLYFVSLTDFTLGFTTVNPQTYDKTISDYVADMYKVRTLKPVGTPKTLLDVYTNSTQTTEGNDVVFNRNIGLELGGAADVNYSENAAEKKFKITFRSAGGTEYGWVITENKTTGEITRKKIQDNQEFDDVLCKIYASQADAEADVGVVPADTIAIIKLGE